MAGRSEEEENFHMREEHVCTEAWRQKTQHGICETMRKYQVQAEWKIANPLPEWTVVMLNVLERKTQKTESNVLQHTPVKLKRDYMQNSPTSSLGSPEGETQVLLITSVLLTQHFLKVRVWYCLRLF